MRPRLRPLLLGLAVLAAGCATIATEPTIFTHTAVNHPEALFDVASRSAALRSISAGARVGALSGIRHH